MKDTYDDDCRELVEEIMREREALRQEGIRREKRERREKNFFYKIFKKLLTLFK